MSAKTSSAPKLDETYSKLKKGFYHESETQEAIPKMIYIAFICPVRKYLRFSVSSFRQLCAFVFLQLISFEDNK